MATNPLLVEAPLGKETTYIHHYAPELLFPIARGPNRQQLGIDTLPFHGMDIWNAFEISWLNLNGKPEVAYAEFFIPCTSPFLIESKSFKLYLNSFNHTKIANIRALKEIISKDLFENTKAEVAMNIIPIEQYTFAVNNKIEGICLDSLDVSCERYDVSPEYLATEDQVIQETVYSHLLKSNCPVTGQPDWATVCIRYQGKKINHEGLLKYIVSFRAHEEFHEQCVERIFMDISRICKPEKLTVYARYTRRGGLDINPFRSNFEPVPENLRLARQ